MTTPTTLKQDDPSAADINIEREMFDRWFDQRFEQKMQEREANHTPSMALIATKGTLDWAYPPFILASTGAALGWEVSVFFTFYEIVSLLLLKKDLEAAVTPVGNPAMPMKLPFGPDWLRGMNWSVPNAIPSLMPGFEKAATSMMKKTFKDKGVASIPELREASIEAGVNLIACQMTVDVFGFERDDFVPEVTEWVGAATFLPRAQEADVTLFI